MNKIINIFENSLKKLYKEGEKNRNAKLKAVKIQSNFLVGRSETMAHIFEHTLAKEFAKNFKKYNVLLDYPLAPYKNNKKINRCNIYPDILLVKNDNIEFLIELKLTIDYIDLEKIEKREEKICEADKFEYNEYSGVYFTNEEKKNHKPQRKTINTKNMKKVIIIVMNSNRKEKKRSKKEEYRKMMESYGYSVIFFDFETYYNQKYEPRIIEKKIKERKKELEHTFHELS